MMKKILLGVMALMMGCLAVTPQPTPSRIRIVED